MLISRNWLQTYFDKDLPEVEKLSDALTFHVFEIDGVKKVGGDAVLEVKVTPNRGHDCLCHRGIAKELSAILKLPIKSDPLGLAVVLKPTDAVSVAIETPLCARYIAGYIKGVKVGPSPQWLRERLESVGQRSINNVVDATNYVMFSLGQPLHAFDTGKLQAIGGVYAVVVRKANSGEKMLALDEKEYVLNESMLVIADGHTNKAIGVAGVKGGMPAGISEATTDIIIESANFDGVSVRKTAQALKLRTDASTRFEQVLSPGLAAQGMKAVVDLIADIAGGELQGFIDVYPKPAQKRSVSVLVEKINQVLGVTLTGADVASVFERLGFSYKEEGGLFEVVVPFERLDIERAEDLIEEVGRIYGYDKVLPRALPSLEKPITINKHFYRTEKIREFLVSQGFSEVITSVFAEEGERVVLNKVDGVKPYLRRSISDSGLVGAMFRNVSHREILGLKKIKIFEMGTVWGAQTEEVKVATLEEKSTTKGTGADALQRGDWVGVEKSLEAYMKDVGLPENPTTDDDFPLSATQRYTVYSKYPYIVRDVAVWVPFGTDKNKVETTIQNEAGELCVKISLFDQFTKDDRTSYAFRLIFQSFDRTLVDEDANTAMEKVYTKLKEGGFEIR